MYSSLSSKALYVFIYKFQSNLCIHFSAREHSMYSSLSKFFALPASVGRPESDGRLHHITQHDALSTPAHLSPPIKITPCMISWQIINTPLYEQHFLSITVTICWNTSAEQLIDTITVYHLAVLYQVWVRYKRTIQMALVMWWRGGVLCNLNCIVWHLTLLGAPPVYQGTPDDMVGVGSWPLPT